MKKILTDDLKKELKWIGLGLLGLIVVVWVIVAFSSGISGTYKGKYSGSDVTFKTDGKTGELTTEWTFLGMKSSSKEKGTIDKQSKTFKSEDGTVYDYIQDGDKLVLSSSNTNIKLTKEK